MLGWLPLILRDEDGKPAHLRTAAFLNKTTPPPLSSQIDQTMMR